MFQYDNTWINNSIFDCKYDYYYIIEENYYNYNDYEYHKDILKLII